LAALNIVADIREKASGIPLTLERLGVKVSYRSLTVGDYILSEDHAVERKEVGDFVSSMISGRLFDQVKRLSEVYRRPIFLVEGDLQETLGHFPNPRALWGALASLSLGYGAHIFYTADRRQSAEALQVLARHVTPLTLKGPVVKSRRKLGSAAEKQLLVVSALPGVGSIFAERLLRRFGSVRKVLNSSTRELAAVEGFGRLRAERIAEVLDAPYRPSKPSGSEGQTLIDRKDYLEA